MLQLCRGSAEIDCPVIGTCRNVGSNFGGHLRADSYGEIGEGNAWEKAKLRERQLLCVKRMSKETWCHQVEQEIKAHL